MPTGLLLFSALFGRATNATLVAVAMTAGFFGALWSMYGYPNYGYRLMTLLAGTSRGKTAGLSTLYMAACGLVYLGAGQPKAPGGLMFLAVPFTILAVVGLAGLIQAIRQPDRLAIGADALRAGKPQVALENWEGAAFAPERRSVLRGFCAQLAQAAPGLALEVAAHLTRVAPAEADNWRARSFLAAQSGDLKTSLAFLDEAMKLNPRNAEDHYNRAVRLSRDPATFEAALKDYTTAIGLDSQQARYWANRAALYNRMGRHDHALADARKASTLDPDDQVARVQAQLAQGGVGGALGDSSSDLGLMRITSSGSKRLEVSGKAEPLFELSHGGYTDQYLEFCPRGRYLASWVPEGLEVFDLESKTSLGQLKGEDRGLVGFTPEGDALLTVRQGGIERHPLPDFDLAQPEAPGEEGPGWRLKDGIAFSTVTGFALSATSPQDTVAFPYHHRMCPATNAIAQPGAHCAMLLSGDRRWSSRDVGRDVTSVGFSADGARLAFGTMGASVFIVDTSGPEVTHQCLADGEIRCLAISSQGLVAVGCADRSSKAWLFDLETGQPAHLVDSSGDTWAVAFSPDGQRLATGHENGKIRVWNVEDLPRPQWA